MKKLPIKKISIGLLVILVIATGFSRVFSKDTTIGQDSSLNTVNLVDVNDYASFDGEINAVGTVEAVDFVTIVSETNSPVAAKLVNPGDYVVAGQPLVLFDGILSSIQLASAEASLRALEAQLAVQTGDPRVEDVQQLKAALDQALAQREQTIQSNKNSIDSATKAINDLYIDGVYDLASYENTVRLSLALISDMQQDYFNCGSGVCARIADYKKEAILAGYGVRDAGNYSAQAVQNLNSGVAEDLVELRSTVDHELFDEARSELEKAAVLTRLALIETRQGFDTYSGAFNATSTEIAAVETKIASVDSVLAALRTLDSTVESTRGDVYANDQFEVLNETVANAEQSRRSVDAAVQTAEARYNALVDGPRDIDVAALRAQVDGARAQYAQALEQSNNQTITAPFDGIVGTVNAPLGQIVSAGQTVVTMFNQDAKRVKIAVSAEKAKEISFHESVIVGDSVEGIIEYVAPQIGNNGGVEVGIVAIDTNNDLTVGETVEVSIRLKNEQNLNSTFNVPLQAVKTNSEGTFVYGVNDDSEIVRYAVTTGQIRGSKIDLFFDEQIPSAILDSVRGIELGEKVEVK